MKEYQSIKKDTAWDLDKEMNSAARDGWTVVNAGAAGNGYHGGSFWFAVMEREVADNAQGR